MRIDYSNTHLPKHMLDPLDVTPIEGSYIVSCQYEELSAWKTNIGHSRFYHFCTLTELYVLLAQ